MRLAPDGRDVGESASRVLAVAIGAGVAVSGFTPVNHLADRLSVNERPWAAILMPSTLLALLAIVAAWRFRGRLGLPHAALWGLSVAALALSAGASVLVAEDPERSVALVVWGVLAPLAFTGALLVSSLPRSYLAGSFLAASAVMVLRADVALFRDYGFPTASDLFLAKFSNAPYDFHYYALGNPNQTAAFLLMPLTLAVAWQVDRMSLPRWGVVGLWAVTAIFAMTTLFAYSRLTILVMVAVLLVSLAMTPGRAWTRAVAACATVAVVVAYFVSESGRDYVGTLTQDTDDASPVVRAESVENGLRTIGDQPLLGTGIGEYGVHQGIVPAHTAVVQQGAETGIFGALGVAGIVVLSLALAVHVGRRDRWRGLSVGGAAAAALYCLLAAATLGLFFHTEAVAIWGMSLGLCLAIAVPPRRDEPTER